MRVLPLQGQIQTRQKHSIVIRKMAFVQDYLEPRTIQNKKNVTLAQNNNLNVSDFLLWVSGQYGTAFMHCSGSTAGVDCVDSS